MIEIMSLIKPGMLVQAALAENHEMGENMRNEQRMQQQRELAGQMRDVMEKCADKQAQAIGGLANTVVC